MESIWEKTCKGPARPPLYGKAQADVAVIGGGMTGILTALELQERGHVRLRFAVKRPPVHMFSGTHVEVQHRVLYPFLLQCLHGQSLKQILPSLEITVKGTGKQRFSETSGTA